MDCPHHEHVASVLQRLEAHCNGNHVQRYEVEQMKGELSRQGDDLAKLSSSLAQIVQDSRIAAARRDSSTKLLVALVGALGVAMQLVITHYMK